MHTLQYQLDHHQKQETLFFLRRLVYDYDRMIAELMDKDNITEEEAIDFIDYNTIRSLPYYGDYAPNILIRKLETLLK